MTQTEHSKHLFLMEQGTLKCQVFEKGKPERKATILEIVRIVIFKYGLLRWFRDWINHEPTRMGQLHENADSRIPVERKQVTSPYEPHNSNTRFCELKDHQSHENEQLDSRCNPGKSNY